MSSKPNSLWVERWRPQNLEDYVWIDDSQKRQVQQWVADKTIPHLLLSGGPGVGKCLGPNQEIDILVPKGFDATYISKYQIRDNIYRIPIIALFKMLGLENIEYNRATDISSHNIRIAGLGSTWVPINHLVRKKTSASVYKFHDGSTLTCANRHIVFDEGAPKEIMYSMRVDSEHGRLTLESEDYAGIIDVYDVSLPPPHKYITSNGIHHHNTTLARCLLNELDVEASDIQYINASHHNGVDFIRNLSGFIETMPMGEYRYILLDEADAITVQGQMALRNMIEEYSNNCRWILTCNYPHKVIDALKSRLQGFHIEKLDRDQFVARTAHILISEGIEFDDNTVEILDEYVTATYPDLRKCINSLQQNSSTGVLTRPSRGGSGSNTVDYLVKAIEQFKLGNIHSARKIICASARPEEYEEIYRLLYSNLNWWGKTDSQQNQAVVIIANRLRDHTVVADAEINLAACLIELSLIE